jgi:hypothetical protein
MEIKGTYESKLLRILIGFLHISLSQQLAITRHGKGFETLSSEEKATIQTDMMQAVFGIAQQVDEATIDGYLKPTIPPSSGKIH